ncbi:MAG: VWA domain-containing protein [Planctomycetota bacterium]
MVRLLLILLSLTLLAGGTTFLPTAHGILAPRGDRELDSAVADRDANAVVRRMKTLAKEDPKVGAKEIPIAYAAIEELPPAAIADGDRYRVFAGAMAALLRIQDNRSITAMEKVFKSSKKWAARFLVLRTSWQHGKMDAVDLAMKGLKDKAPQVVAMSARILGNSKKVEAIDPCLAAMQKWEKREHREKVHVGRDQVNAELGGRAWIACRDALNRLTGKSFHAAADYKNYVSAHRGKIDPTKVEIEEKTKRENATGVGLFGLDLSGRNIVFILDISGSMESTDPFTPEQMAELNRPGRTWAGDKDPLEEKFLKERKRILRAKRELKAVIRSLPEDKNFNIVIYSNDVTPWKRFLVDATPKNKEAAEKFVDEIKAHGVTFTDDALRAGLEDPSVDTIYLITDGAPTHIGSRGKDLPPDARELMQWIHDYTRATNYLRGVRIFTLGFEGAEEDFLKELAKHNYGSYVRIE